MNRYCAITRLFFLSCVISTPAAALTFTVTNGNDTGAGSLRQAISDANAAAGADIIDFNIPGTEPQIISPISALPDIIDPLTIDGYTQPSAVANANPAGQGLNTVLRIELRGPGTSVADRIGLLISAGNSTVRGLAINSFGGGGIVLQTNEGNVIAGNFIGTDAAGTVALPNGVAGVNILSSGNNTIGGIEPTARNLISGNADDGIHIGDLSTTDSDSTGNLVQGNLIGTDITGTVALSNLGNGVAMDEGAAANTIGGVALEMLNLISGNSLAGVSVSGEATDTNLIQGNFIGTEVTGVAELGNGSVGVLIDEDASANEIGGSADSGAANTIAFNGDSEDGGAGVRVVSGVRNLIAGNSIFSNIGTSTTGLGIDLDPAGITANDAIDSDSGANELQNFPVIDSAMILDGITTVTGTLNSRPDTAYTLEFFASPLSDESGSGEGQALINSVTVVTSGSGDVSFTEDLSGIVGEGQFLTATAIDPEGNTSEFSAALQVSGSALGPGTLQYSATTFSANEDVGEATITVTRNGGSSGTVSVRFETRDITSSAVTGEDYSFTEGTLTFVDGDATPQTFTVPIINDTADEANENLMLLLSEPGGGATLGTPDSAMLTIVDNDSVTSPGGGTGDGSDSDGECCRYPIFGSCSLCLLCRPGASTGPDPTLPALLLISVLYLLRRRIGRKK